MASRNSFQRLKHYTIFDALCKAQFASLGRKNIFPQVSPMPELLSVLLAGFGMTETGKPAMPFPQNSKTSCETYGLSQEVYSACLFDAPNILSAIRFPKLLSSRLQ